MSFTLGLNAGSPSPSYTSRLQTLANIGPVRIVRYDYQVSGSNFKGALDYAAAHGFTIMPQISNYAGLKAFWDQFGKHPGFCGVAELGNETYLQSGPTGTSYWGSVVGGITALKQAHPEAKVIIQATVDHQPQWVDQIFAAGGQKVVDLVYGWSIHPYCVGKDPTANVQPATAWQLRTMNAKLAAQNAKYPGANKMPLWATEWGFSIFKTGWNIVPDGATQAAYIQKSIALYTDPANNVETAFYYELTKEPGQAGNQEGWFGVADHDNDTAASRTLGWGVLHAWFQSNPSAKNNFSQGGSTTPPVVTPPVVTPPPATQGQASVKIGTDPTTVVFTVPSGTAKIQVFESDRDAYPLAATEYTQTTIEVPTGPWASPRAKATGKQTYIDVQALDSTGNKIGMWFSSSPGGGRVKVNPPAVAPPVEKPDPDPDLALFFALWRTYHNAHEAGNGKDSRTAYIALDKQAVKLATTYKGLVFP